MPFRFRCPCGHSLCAADDKAGKLIACPNCRSTLRIPIPRAPQAPVKQAPQVKQAPPVSPPPVPRPASLAREPILLPEELEEVIETIPIFDQEEIETIPVFDEIEVVQEAPPALVEESALRDMAPLPAQPPGGFDGVADSPEFGQPAAARPTHDDLPPLPEAPEPEDDLEEAVAVFDKLEIVQEEEGGAYGVRDDGDDVTANHSLTGALVSYPLDAGPINAIAYPPHGVKALVADDDELMVLDLKTRDCWSIGGAMHDAPIHCLSISADGRRALSGDTDGALMLWELGRARPLGWLDGHRDGVTTVDFSPDGSRAASGGLGGAVLLWDCASRTALSLDQAQLGQAVGCVRFSSDGRLLLGLGNGGRARLWNVADGTVALPMQPGAERLRSAGFSPEAGCVVAGSANRFQVCKWDLADGKRDPCFKGFSKRHPRVRRTWVTPDGRCLLALAFTLHRGPRKEIDGAGSLLYQAGLRPWTLDIGEQYFANTWTMNQRTVFHLERWDIAYQNAMSFVDLGNLAPTALACAADGRRVLVGFASGLVRLFAL